MHIDKNGIDKNGALHFSIMQTHIDTGCKGDSDNCAAARAIVAQGHSRVAVDGDTVETSLGSWFCGERLAEFIGAFDSECGNPQPGAFVLEPYDD